jgi:uncharacterized protein (DUF111 family)
MTMLEANIDDMNPEFYPYLLQKLLSGGARDAFLTPVIMKKGRPAIQVSVILAENLVQEMESLIFTHTTTLGIRRYSVDRTVLEREFALVNTRFGKIRAKKVMYNNKVFYRPEFEECLRLAEKLNINLHEIYREIDGLNK